FPATGLTAYDTTPEPLAPEPEVILIQSALACACQAQEPDAFTSITVSPPAAVNLAGPLPMEILQEAGRLRSFDATPPASESIKPSPIPMPIGGMPMGPEIWGNCPICGGTKEAAQPACDCGGG